MDFHLNVVFNKSKFDPNIFTKFQPDFDVTSVWATNDPTLMGVIFYNLVIPILCQLGIITNILNIYVFTRKRLLELAGSSYSYFIGLCAPKLKVYFFPY